jgi:hypothetical protein
MNYIGLIQKYDRDFSMSIKRFPIERKTVIKVDVVAFSGQYSETLQFFDREDKLSEYLDQACGMLYKTIMKHEGSFLYKILH